jgi:hypothetical protein
MSQKGGKNIMKKIMVAIAVVSVCVLMAGTSQAALINGQIWAPVTGYNETTHDLSAAPGAVANASFTVDMINFDSQALAGSYGGPVTYTQFLSNSLSGAPGPNNLVWSDGASATFGAQTLITSSVNTSFFQLTGTAYFPANVTIRHDDGFRLDLGGTIYDYSHPTAPETASLNNAAGVYSFTLNYAAWNSFPEVLQVSQVNPVPIPAAAWLLGSGLLGLIGIRRRFKK